MLVTDPFSGPQLIEFSLAPPFAAYLDYSGTTPHPFYSLSWAIEPIKGMKCSHLAKKFGL
jgi:hypothetical protein